MNDISDHPHIIDTADPGLVYTGNIAILSVRWVGATTVGHKLIVQRADGRVVWESEAGSASYVEKDLVNRIAKGGYKVTTLDSGRAYIEVAHPDALLKLNT